MQSFDQIWDVVLEILKEKCTKSVYDLWFADTKLIYLDSEKAAVTINSDLKKNIIANKYVSLMTEALSEVIGFETTLEIYSDEHEPVVLPAKGEEGASVSLEKAAAPAAPVQNPSSNEEYTFANFMVGSSNKFAYAACTAVAKRSASTFNPLFIHGASGLGKTHLLYAIMNELSENFPSINLVYIKGEQFTTELIESIARENTVAFRNKYRKADVLLIDDIQFIAGKESTQEEFFHTFNALYEEHKQIILVADRPPKDMKTLEDRLRSRFEGGLIVDVQPPDYELRLAILKNKAKLIGVDIPLPILQYLADCLRSNIRQIEGVVKKIAAQSFLTGMPVSKEIAERCVAEIDEGGLTEGEMVERIIAKIASNYRMSPEDLKGRKKSKEIANARHICIYIIRNMTEMSLPSIGNIFGRDHSTILNSIDVIEKRMKQSPMLDLEIRDLMKEIREA
jgi:chromosomal replication initiator protein